MSNDTKHQESRKHSNDSHESKDETNAKVDESKIDEAVEESFPASDPPSYSAGTATPSKDN